MSQERVAIVKVREQRLDEAVEGLIAHLGGLDSFGWRGQRVIIKPNYTIAPTDVGVTHPEVVEAVLRLVTTAGPREAIIAESSGDNYTSFGFRLNGIYRIAARYGARVVDLNDEEAVRVPVPSDTGRDYVMLPREVAEADALISIPIFKLWGDSPLSLSLKNLFGLYGGRYYGHNKDSNAIVVQRPEYGLPGEVGSEMGIHQPTTPHSVCAINSAAKITLAIIDALEGGDGRGNWIRLDTLIGGRNPVATDTVGMAMAGLNAADYPTFRLCAEHGLGPCQMEQIEVVGERVQDVAFDLTRLRGNVLEMPLAYCLNLLSAPELAQMRRSLAVYGLAPAAGAPAGREALLAELLNLVGAEGYYARALALLDPRSRVLLDLILAMGGTAGHVIAIKKAMAERFPGWETSYYAPAARELTRLGLAYVAEGLNRPYYLLPEGLAAAYRAARGS